MPYTVANQRTVTIHRERAVSDFLGIKNTNWQAAARDLRPHALTLYLYLASNANNYNLALSPAAVRQSIGMARSTYHDQFQILLDKGYLVQNGASTYDFYETPKPRTATPPFENPTTAGLNFEDTTSLDLEDTSVVIKRPPNDIEINNKLSINNSINSGEKSKIEAPKVKEIVIPNPSVKPKVQKKNDYGNKPVSKYIF